MTITIKQEKFARKYIECGNASEAYRHAYSAKNMKQDAIAVEAHRVLSNPNVSLMVAKLQQQHAKRHAVTVDTISKELDEARELALSTEQPSAMVSASMGKAKLHGLLVDKSEVTGKDGAPLLAIQELNDEQVDARIAALIAQAGIAGAAGRKGKA